MSRADPRMRLAVLGGKVTAWASRSLRMGGGTTLPGDVARAIDPRVLSKLAASPRRGIVLITGTNGKTTTSALLRRIAAAAGWRTGGNQSGSNLIYGLTAAAIAQADIWGRMDLDWLVLEVDELSAVAAARELQPNILVVLNAFRDQLDRSFEVDQVAARLGEAVTALPEKAVAVLNSDDPRVAALDRSARASLFGIEDRDADRGGLPESADRPVCPRCGGSLQFGAVYYGQCGDYRCPACGWSRPSPAVRVTRVLTAGLDHVEFTLVGPGGGVGPLEVPLAGAHNAANVAAAAAAALEMGANWNQIEHGLRRFRPAFGRSQVVRWRQRQVRLLLAKNPAGMQASLEAVLSDDAGPVLGLALNDGIADGTDISWIWDVEFEKLATVEPLWIVLSGRRAAELALRLRYAGLDASRLMVRPAPEEALDELAERAAPGMPAPALLTYTAMLDWHRAVVGAGGAQPFWTEG
jgi:UDP-N-acetylmuramyl tripeptide synthase